MSDDNSDAQAEHFQTSSGTHWPRHDVPRVWFMTDGNSPIATALARQLLDHGDCVVVGTTRRVAGNSEEDRDDLLALQVDVEKDAEAKKRLQTISIDIRSMGDSQAAISTAVKFFGKLDVLLCCTGEALIGSIEEVSQSARTQSLVTNQFSANFFGPVNIIKSTLPIFRAQKDGHIVLLSGITGHLGTPGLGMYCASQWAIEGYCDSLAYEVAPFNIKISIVQSSIEVSVLTNKITAAPPMDAYSQSNNKAPLARNLWAGLLDKLDEASTGQDANVDPALCDTSTAESERRKPSELLNSGKCAELYPRLPEEFKDSIIAETVHALTAIGGHANPPARHIVGFEGVASVKEKLRTVSEELEDLFDISGAVDL